MAKIMLAKQLRRWARAGRHFGLTWRYMYNLGPSLAYRLGRGAVSGEGAHVLSALNRDGIAITSVQALIGTDSCYQELVEAVARAQDTMTDRFALARAAADTAAKTGGKTFNLEYLGSCPALDPDSVYARFALQKPILQIANAYLGMYTRLRYYNIWHTLVTRLAPRESQLWHRDREDRYILKVFVYLSDVDEGAGPLSYIPGSHLKGKRRREPAYSVEGVVRRSDDAQMAEVTSPECWIKATGQKGTIVFADTHGFHKGGLAREHERLMYLCMFTSPASESQELLKRPVGLNRPHDRQTAFALAPPKRGTWYRFDPPSQSA